VFVVGCALGASALGDDGPGTTTDTVPTTTTAATSTTTATTTSTATAPALIADGVTIGGVAVGGFAAANATEAVRAAFMRPLTLVFQRHRLVAAPNVLGAVGFARRAVSTALHSPPGTRVPLQVSVRPGPLRRYLLGLAAKLDRRPVDATLSLRRGRPFLTR